MAAQEKAGLAIAAVSRWEVCRKDLAKFGMKELEALQEQYDDGIRYHLLRTGWCVCTRQADTVALMMRRVYDIGGSVESSCRPCLAHAWVNMPLAGTSGDRCAVYLNGRAMFAKSKNKQSQKAVSPVWANTCWQNHFSKESWMPKTLPTIAATFTMEMGMHLHRLGSVGRSESQRVDTVVACCCHVYRYLFYTCQMDPNGSKLQAKASRCWWPDQMEMAFSRTLLSMPSAHPKVVRAWAEFHSIIDLFACWIVVPLK